MDVCIAREACFFSCISEHWVAITLHNLVMKCWAFVRRIGNLGEKSMSTTLDRVTKIVIEQLSCEEDKVVPEASFIDDLGADSLDTVELVMAFEEEFDIEIPDEVAETIQTVADAVAKIDEHAS